MPKKINKFVYWAPRILSILFILLLGSFSTEAFNGGGFWQTLETLLMINFPSLVLLAIWLISWKNKTAGVIAFALAGLPFIALWLISPSFEWAVRSWLLLISIPALLIGILSLVNRLKKK